MPNEASYNCCPACGRRIEPRIALLHNDTVAFRCRGCDARLVKKVGSVWLAMGGVLVWFPVKQVYGWGGWQTWAAIAAVFASVSAIALNRTRVRLATASDPDPQPKLKKEVIPDGPPPMDQSFRGMSGPPPGAPAGKDSSAN